MSTDLAHVVAVTSPATPARKAAGVFTPPGTEGLIRTISKSPEELGVALLAASRESVVPKVVVRVARESDFDDLVPILKASQEACPALAQLPAWLSSSSGNEEGAVEGEEGGSDQHNEYALTELIRASDKTQQLLVAEMVGVGVVGFTSLSSGVDLRVLYDYFDLDTYDWFLSPDQYDGLVAAAQAGIRGGTSPLVEEVRAERIRMGLSPTSGKSRSPTRLEEEGLPGPELSVIEEASRELLSAEESEVLKKGEEEEEEDGSVASPGGSPTGEEGEKEEGEGDHEEASRAPPTPLPEPLVLSEEEERVLVRREMLRLVEENAEGSLAPQAFALTMLCFQPGQESVGMDLLAEAFKAFPDKDYCVLTMPHDSPVPATVAHFDAVPAVPGIFFPENLYCFHGAGLTKEFLVRPARLDDAFALRTLTEDMPNQEDILQSFSEGLADDKGACGVFAAECAGQVVGMATLIGQVDLESLASHYRLDALLSVPHHSPFAHAELDMFTISPVFAWRSRFMLRECMRLMGRTCLYYALPVGEAPQAVLKEFFQAQGKVPGPALLTTAPEKEAGGGHDAAATTSLTNATAATTPNTLPSFSLSVLPIRLTHATRPLVTSRVVFLGASDANLACMESLLCSQSLRFDALTLVSSAGHPTGLSAAARMAERLGLDGNVTVLCGHAVELDRSQKLIVLDDGAEVPYDVLILGTGRHDVSLDRVYDAEEAAGRGRARPPVVTFEELCMSLDPNVAVELAHSARETQLPVVVVGETSHALMALDLLRAHGFPTQYLVHAAGPHAFAGLVEHVSQAAIAACNLPAVNPAGLIIRSPTHIPEGGAAGQADEEKKTKTQTKKTDATWALRGVVSHTETAVTVELAEVPRGQDAESSIMYDTTRLDARLVVMCGPPRVDPATLAFAHASGLVFNGRLVVSDDFTTNDRDVYAVGPLAKYSAEYGLNREMQNMDSVALGSRLARSLAGRFARMVHAVPDGEADGTTTTSPSGVAGNAVLTPHTAPQLTTPKLFIYRGNSNSTLAFAATPGTWAKAEAGVDALVGVFTPDVASGQRVLETSSGEATSYARILLSAEGLMEAVIFVGPSDHVLVRRVGSLAGLHVSYVGGDAFIAQASAPGADLVTLLNAPWMKLLYEPVFTELREMLLECMALQVDQKAVERLLASEEEQATSSREALAVFDAAAKVRTQEALLAVLATRRTDLGVYHV